MGGNRLYREKGRMIDGLHGSQYLSSRNLYMTVLDFEHEHGRV